MITEAITTTKGPAPILRTLFILLALIAPICALTTSNSKTHNAAERRPAVPDMREIGSQNMEIAAVITDMMRKIRER